MKCDHCMEDINGRAKCACEGNETISTLRLCANCLKGWWLRKKKNCVDCGRATRATPQQAQEQEDFYFAQCAECRDEEEAVDSLLEEEAKLDPTGPAAFVVSGGKLRRGWS